MLLLFRLLFGFTPLYATLPFCLLRCSCPLSRHFSPSQKLFLPFLSLIFSSEYDFFHVQFCERHPVTGSPYTADLYLEAFQERQRNVSRFVKESISVRVFSFPMVIAGYSTDSSARS